MPIEILDMDDGRGNILIARGVFKSQEYIESLCRHLDQEKEKFKKYTYSITDLTAVTEATEWPTDDVHLSVNMCKKAAQINHTAVVAIVADNDFLFGLSRMWEILMYEAGWETMVFKKRDAAELWIKEKVKVKFGIEDLTFEVS